MVVAALHCYFSHGYKIIIKSHMSASIIILHIPAIKPRRDWTRPAWLWPSQACSVSTARAWSSGVCMCELLFLPVGCLKSLCHLHCRQLHFPHSLDNWLSSRFDQWWKTGGQDKPEYFSSFLLPKRLSTLAAVFACLFMQFQAHSLGSQLLQNSPCHIANSHPMASGSGSSNIYPSCVPSALGMVAAFCSC